MRTLPVLLIALSFAAVSHAQDLGLESERFRSINSEKFPARSIASVGEVVSYGGGESSREADQLALESCEALARGPCALKTRVVRASVEKLNQAPESRLDLSERVFNPARVPFVWEKDRLRVYSEAHVKFKALSVSASGAWAWRAGPSVDAAKASAVDACRAVNARDQKAAPCLVYAVNDDVVLRNEDIGR